MNKTSSISFVLLNELLSHSQLKHKNIPSILTHKAPPIICSRRQLQILPLFQKITNVSCNIIPYSCRKLGKMSQNLSPAAVVIGALRVNTRFGCSKEPSH